MLRNKTISVPLKHLSSFWRLPKIQLIICKVQLKLKCMTQCVLASAGTDVYSDNVIFTNKDTKVYVKSNFISKR